MKDYQLTRGNLEAFVEALMYELEETPLLVANTNDPKIGKWGMARLWRSWMAKTAQFMAGNGSKMPLYIKSDGSHYGSRAFNNEDAHELFTAQWLGVDAEGNRLSWAKKSHDGKRAATKGERFNAMLKHEAFCVEKGIFLLTPKDSDFFKLKEEQSY